MEKSNIPDKKRKVSFTWTEKAENALVSAYSDVLNSNSFNNGSSGMKGHYWKAILEKFCEYMNIPNDDLKDPTILKNKWSNLVFIYREFISYANKSGNYI